jgi:aminopeptidase N
VKTVRFLLFLLITQVSWAQQRFLSSGFEKQTLIEQEKKRFLHAANGKSCALSSNYNVTYYRCNWNIDPALNYISGTVTMNFTALSALDSLQMDLSIALTADSVLYHGVKTSLLQKNGDVLEIKFPATISVSQADSLTVFYHGIPVSSGFGSFVQSSHAGAPVIWTLSEPYGAKDWWPCKNTLDDKADSIDVYLSVPAGNKGASNGLLKQITPSGTKNIYHWKHRYPIATYLICSAVTNYTEYTDTAHLSTGAVPVLNYVYPEDTAISHSVEPQLLTVLHFYDSLFVPYPFMQEKYGQCEFGWGGGQEHQTMTFLGGYFIELQAHELAHHWFGDKITCGSWTDIWLNEGFAVYCTGLSFNRLFGPDVFHSWLQQDLANATSQADGSVFVTDTTDVSRIFSGTLTYDKGAYLLHMLRWKLGDNSFFQGLRDYQNDPALKYSFARTSNLQYHLENASGINLSNFFTQWFYGQGYPKYFVIWNQDKNNQLKIILNQSTSHPSVPFFEMPVPVRVKGQGRDTTLVFDHTYSGQTFYSNLNFKVDTVLFDPDLNILSLENQVMYEYDYLRSLQKLVIYPNPCSSQLNVEVNETASYPERAELYNILGEKMLEINLHANKFSLDVSGFSEGTYFLQIRSGSKVTTHKVILARP